jgi:hypothetical protein
VSVNNILPLGQITHPLLTRDISFGILIFEYTVNLISLIECKDKRTERVIKTTGSCYGIAYHKGTLLLCERSRGLIKIELSNDRFTTLVKDVNLPDDHLVITLLPCCNKKM